MPQPPASAQAPDVPPPPPPPPTPEVVLNVPGVFVGPLTGVPQTAQELRALRERREELSDQLISATERRDELASEIEGTSGANRAGLEQRLQLLDARILRLESDIAETGRQLAAAPAHLLASAESRFEGTGLSSDQVTGISIVAIIFVLFPIVIVLSVMMMRRAGRQPSRLPPDSAQRLQRMEQAVDAIAIEVERISEGQRFLTRLFTDTGAAPALAAGQRAADQHPVPEADAVRVPRAGA